MRKHTGAFHGYQHFTIKRGLEKCFCHIARFIILLIQGNIYLPVGIYLKVANIATPTAVAVKCIAYIGIATRQSKPDFIFAGLPWNKTVPRIGSLYVEFLLLQNLFFLLRIVPEVSPAFLQNGSVFVFNNRNLCTRSCYLLLWGKCNHGKPYCLVKRKIVVPGIAHTQHDRLRQYFSRCIPAYRPAIFIEYRCKNPCLQNAHAPVSLRYNK